MTSSAGAVPADPQPGTNLKDAPSGAAWTYLLDDLDVANVVCLGRPTLATRATLDRIADTVTVLDDPAMVDGPAGGVDLVYVAPSSSLAATSAVLGRVARLLSPRGRIFVDEDRTGVMRGLLSGAGLDRIDAYCMTPSRGEPRSAVPVAAEAVRRYFATKGLTASNLPRRLRRFDRIARWRRGPARVGLLAGHGEPDVPSGTRLPKYLQRMAADADIDLSSHSFGLSALGRYSSRKVLFYLFAPGDPRASIIVKTTRDPRHNHRLANEEWALRHVAEHELVPKAMAPRVVFSGEHGGLRVVAEAALDGDILSAHPSRRAGRNAYELLTQLAATSARRGAEEAESIATRVEGITAAVERVYRPESRIRDRLRDATRTLADNADCLPIVFMHGDAGSWNVLANSAGQASFLDWEAAELDGMPLWDLFHFMRSHVLDRALIRRVARRPRRLLRAMRADPDARSAVATYRQRLDIPAELTVALMSIGWAHRALREVSRLDRGRLHEGHYFGLLRASLALESFDEPVR